MAYFQTVLVIRRNLIINVFQTILEDSNGSSQNSRSVDRGGSPSDVVPASTAGISQNHSSGSQLSPYFSSSSNSQTVNIQPIPACSQLANQSVVRSAMQLHQMVSYQLAGQTVAMSTVMTQATQSTSNNCSMPVIQPVAAQSERSSPLVEDMAWVSWSICIFSLKDHYKISQLVPISNA